MLIAAVGPEHIAATVLIDVAIIMVAARAAGALARRLGQPAVIGEIMAGIALGPSLLGALPGNLDTNIFPLEARPTLSAVATLGLVLFMFLVGLEVDPGLLRGRVRLATSISISSIILPFVLGVPLAVLLHQRHDGGEASSLSSFALFIGASMSVTAFPVLARILVERKMERTPLGALALASAAVDDVVAWSLLALVVAIVANGSASSVAVVLVSTALFFASLALVVRPALARLEQRALTAGQVSADTLALVVAAVLGAAWVTDRIGVHVVFGAFALGTIMPRGGVLREAVAERIESVTVLVLLPVFFIATGLTVNLREVGGNAPLELLAILAVAFGGKIGGAAGAARFMGLSGRRSLALGILANTRGLTELVILEVGRSLGVLDQELFGLLVVMALVTTATTTPLLGVVYPRNLVDLDIAEAERPADAAHTVLVALDSAEGAESVLAVSKALAGSAPRGHIALSRFVAPSTGDRITGYVPSSLSTTAAYIEEMAIQARSVSGSHVTASPAVMMSADPAADLDRQAERLNADWIVTTSSLGNATHDLLIVSGSASGSRPVVDLTSDDPAAWEVAARLCLSWDGTMTVSARHGRRRLVDAARQLTLEVDDPNADATVADVVVGTEAVLPNRPDQLVITVQAHEDRTRLGLRERLDRIGPPSPRSTPTAPPPTEAKEPA